jgi:hypothetical protein
MTPVTGHVTFSCYINFLPYDSIFGIFNCLISPHKFKRDGNADTWLRPSVVLQNGMTIRLLCHDDLCIVSVIICMHNEYSCSNFSFDWVAVLGSHSETFLPASDSKLTHLIVTQLTEFSPLSAAFGQSIARVRYMSSTKTKIRLR